MSAKAQTETIVKAHAAELARECKCLADDLERGVDAAILREHYREMVAQLDRIGVGLGMRRPSVTSLTPRQREVFEWIAKFIEAHGDAPTFKQICEGQGFTSIATVNKYIAVFERLELLTRNGRNWTINAG